MSFSYAVVDVGEFHEQFRGSFPAFYHICVNQKQEYTGKDVISFGILRFHEVHHEICQATGTSTVSETTESLSAEVLTPSQQQLSIAPDGMLEGDLFTPSADQNSEHSLMEPGSQSSQGKLKLFVLISKI